MLSPRAVLAMLLLVSAAAGFTPAHAQTLAAPRILIESRPVKEVGRTTYEHLYLVLEGTPEGNRLLSATAQFSLALMKIEIVVNADVALAGSIDDRGNESAAQRHSREVPLNGRNAEDVWALMTQHAQTIADAHHYYDLLLHNSNTFVVTLLNVVGIDFADTVPLGKTTGNYPGSNRTLAIPVRLEGTPRDDLMRGDVTDDSFVNGGGTDMIAGGEGYDRYSVSSNYDSATGQFSLVGRVIITDSDGRGVLDGAGGSVEGHGYGVYEPSGQLSYYQLIAEATAASFATRFALKQANGDLLIWLMDEPSSGTWVPNFSREADYTVKGWRPGQLGIFLLDCRTSSSYNPSGSRTCYEFVDGTPDGERFEFGDGAQVLRADGYGASVGAADTARLGGGNDVGQMGPGNDTVYGGSGKDFLVGDAGDDLVYGGDGDDTIQQNAGNNTLIAAEINDVDELHGEAGNDLLSAYGGFKYLDGGPGDDTLLIAQGFTGAPSTAPSRLSGGEGQNTFDVDRVSTTLQADGAGYQRYKISRATLEQGYYVVINHVEAVLNGKVLNGEVIIGGRRILNARTERQYELTYIPQTEQLSIRLRPAAQGAAPAAVTSQTPGTVMINAFYDGAFGIVNVDGAPPPPWRDGTGAAPPVERVYLPAVQR